MHVMMKWHACMLRDIWQWGWAFSYACCAMMRRTCMLREIVSGGQLSRYRKIQDRIPHAPIMNSKFEKIAKIRKKNLLFLFHTSPTILLLCEVSQKNDTHGILAKNEKNPGNNRKHCLKQLYGRVIFSSLQNTRVSFLHEIVHTRVEWSTKFGIPKFHDFSRFF